ncbi:ABC transporter substrate-binding protein [Microbacterium sp. NIBRBAC000506063]|uniref:ABC transporter substrate-binding protein n=1 Tax=Microbacterium sp. NIBRBAC000506063 TaxID=2734618 RepID=UPI001BB735EB|nr:ABC transporter substrate-binding protein [Microbacterium sp. NIBRBAC000506063]QTV79954.1 ABC transporter substrate-binding protein [Microbacterium sp. NIBRBAC000506063]
MTTWDPVRSFSTEAFYMGNVYETLLKRNPEGSAEEFTPVLASSWDASEDGLTWTFHLQEDATFHSGAPVDSAAVKASIEAAQEYAGASFIWAPLASIDTPDDKTVVMNLSYAAPMDLIAASTYAAWIVEPSALEASKDDEDYFEAGIDAGSGPFTVASYRPGAEVVLEAAENYWNAENQPHYDTVSVQITPDAITAQQMLTAGEVDLATNIPLENLESVAQQIGGELRASNSPNNFVGFFNTQRPPLDDPKVRQALSYAIPYDDIVEVGAYGYATQSRGPAPKGIFPYSDDVPQYTYDLDKARELLEEAGVSDLELTLTYSSENPNSTRFSPLIKDSFAQIGVDVTVRGMLWADQWALARGPAESDDRAADLRDAQDMFVVLYWPAYSDAGVDNLPELFGSWDGESRPFFNLSYWSNPAYDALIGEAATLSGSDRDAAQAKYEEAMTLLVDEAPGFFLYDQQAVQIVPPDLEIAPFNENYPFTTFFASIKPKA